MADVQITVLLATNNGGEILSRTLEGYRRVLSPPVAWKMVIVDSASTDSTPQVIEYFKQYLPLHSVRQPLPGKSRALNSGLAAVEGNLAIVTDDDSIPDPSFLQAWAKVSESKSDYDLFGGSIEPYFDFPPPPWLIRSKLDFSLMFAERDLPEGPTDTDAIFGGNMAVRVPVFQRGFKFDEDLGPNRLDPAYPMGSETEFCRRVAQAGAGCWFAREPLVRHIVRREQLSASAWANRAYRCGRGRAYQMCKRGKIVPPPAPSPLQRLAMISPMARHRFKSLTVRHLARGFRDECARWWADRETAARSSRS